LPNFRLPDDDRFAVVFELPFFFESDSFFPLIFPPSVIPSLPLPFFIYSGGMEVSLFLYPQFKAGISIFLPSSPLSTFFFFFSLLFPILALWYPSWFSSSSDSPFPKRCWTFRTVVFSSRFPPLWKPFFNLHSPSPLLSPPSTRFLFYMLFPPSLLSTNFQVTFRFQFL